MQINEKNHSWKTSNGHSIYAKLVFSEHPPKAIIGMVHGMGGHFDRYTELIEQFIERGFWVFGFDQLGHGRSTGRRGDTPSHKLLVENIAKMVEQMKEIAPNTKTVLFGHSMGGNVLMNYLLNEEKNVDAAILSAPWIKLVNGPASLTLRFARFVARIYPQYLYTIVSRTNSLSRDKEFLENYLLDRWCHSSISIRFYLFMRMAGRRIIKNANALRTPMFLYHGTGDKITSYKASKEFYDQLENKELVQFKLLDGVYHEPHNDIGKQQLFIEIVNFIQVKLQLDLIA